MSLYTRLQTGNFALDAAAGKVEDVVGVNKFGRSTNVDASTDTDIHDGANPTDDLDIWVAPTTARVHAIVSTDANDVTAAATLTMALNAADTETVTIGAKVYTFQTVLTDVDGNVLIGATASDSIDNLIAAINLGAGAGTLYATSTTANVISVSAVAGAGDTMTLYVATAGAIATTETGANMSWGGATAVLGTGARTLRVYGLTAWTTAEVSEDINLTGITAVNTVNSYVIIHRMEVLTKGASGPNVGVITATAATDGTVTAQVNAGKGQTQMAIYGVPSTKSAYITQYYASVIKAAAALTCSISLLANHEPASELTAFLVKHTNGADTAGDSYIPHKFEPYYKIAGPAIIKLQANASAANTDISGGFDMYLMNN